MHSEHSPQPVPLGRRACLLIGLAALAAVLIRVPFFSWPLDVDEAAYAYTSYWWARGVPLYSQDLWLDRAQGIFVAYRLAQSLFGGGTWGVRMLGGLAAAGAAGALYLVARHLYDEHAAAFGSLIFAVFSAAPQIEGFTCNGEILMALPATLSAWFLLRRRPFWAGLTVTAAVLIKPSGASGILLAGLWFLYRRAGWREWARFGVGGLLPVLAAAGHGMATVGLAQYAYGVALFEMGPAWGPHIDVWAAAAKGWAGASLLWGPLLLLGLPVLRRARRDAQAFTLCWLLSALAGMAMGGRWFVHYFIQWMPPLALWAGAGLAYLWRSRRLWVRCEGLAIVVLAFLVTEGWWLLRPPNRFRLAYRIDRAVGEYIRAHTGEGETIYVAFFHTPIYYYAQRRSVSPYLFTIHLQYYPGAYDRLVRAVEDRQPTYVLMLDPPFAEADPENRFGQALERNYQVETHFEGVPLYRRRGDEEPAAFIGVRAVRSPCAPAARPSTAQAAPGLSPIPCGPCRD